MFIKQSTAYTFRFGPFLDDTDGKTAETGLTIEDSHVRVSKAGANFIDKAETSNSSHDEAGFYVVVLNATDTNTVGELQIACHMSGALPVFKTFQVLEEAIYDALFAASASAFDANARVDVASIEGSDATDQINAACDTALSDYDAPTKAEMDSAFSTTNGKIDTVDDFLVTEIAAILADTNELQGDWVNGGRLDLLLDSVISKVDVIDGIVDSILVDTGTTLDGKIDAIDTVVDAILVDTAVIGSNGAGLSAIPWNSSWDSEVQSECNDALVALGLDHLISASVAGSDVADNSIIAKLVSKESTADWDDFVNTTDSLQAQRDGMWTTVQTESYASDGSEATPAQLLYMILCSVSEFAISGTTITGKKVDGCTTAMTWTINDASNPTSRTRAS